MASGAGDHRCYHLEGNGGSPLEGRGGRGHQGSASFFGGILTRWVTGAASVTIPTGHRGSAADMISKPLPHASALQLSLLEMLWKRLTSSIEDVPRESRTSGRANARPDKSLS